MNDFVSGDESRYIDALPVDYISDTEFKRVSGDKKVNENGHSLIDFCRHAGLRIANGRIGEDAEYGKCTYVESVGSSLIDYVLVDENVFESFSAFTVRDPNILSDHGRISFALDICSMGEEMFEYRKGDGIKVESKYVKQSDQYRRALASDNTTESLQEAFRNLNHNCSDQQVEESIHSFVDVLDSVGKPLFGKHISGESECKPKSTMLFIERL